MSLDLMIVRPGGNDTCLVFGNVGNVGNAAQRKTVNDAVMLAYPNVEQVGFVSSSSGTVCLQMAGGEFCGNATRSAAAALLSFRTGDIMLQVSGISGTLEAGVLPNGDAYAQMPVYADPTRIRKVKDNAYIVEMEGITHYVMITDEDTTALPDKDIKNRAYDILAENGLLNYPASGVMYARTCAAEWRIDPVVYVRDIDTLFRETACGSGTTALGLVLAKVRNNSIEVPVVQPSGMNIIVSVTYDNTFKDAQIRGPIRMLGQATLEYTPRFTYVVERVRDDRLELLRASELTGLYRTLFSRAPYFESFSDEEAYALFRTYASTGLLYIARVGSRIIGFGAALPLSSQPEIASILAARQVSAARCWYMADLGVDDEYRRSGVATQLVLKRLNDMPPGSIAVMRTSVRNEASRKLYEQLGFRMVEGAFQNVIQRRVGGSEVEDTRLFLAKQLP